MKMFLRCLVVTLALAAAAANVVKHNKVQRAFEKYGLVPDVVDVGPKHLLSAKYPSGAVANLGNVIAFSQLQAQPEVSYEANSNHFYTLVYVDPDHNKDSNCKQYVALLLINIPGNKLNEGQVIADFIGAPLETCSDYHRFTGLVFKQQGKIAENDWPTVEDRDNFSISELVEEYDLEDPVAGNFLKTRKEEGCTYTDSV